MLDKKVRVLRYGSNLVPTVQLDYRRPVLRQFPFFGEKFIQLNQISAFYHCWTRSNMYVLNNMEIPRAHINYYPVCKWINNL